jgi:hypothetical protein
MAVIVSNTDKRQIAGETLELGVTLFDTLIEALECTRNGVEGFDSVDAEEANAAANEFFATLRLLLGLNEGR